MDLEKNTRGEKTLLLYDNLRKEPKEARIEKIRLYLDGKYRGLKSDKLKDVEKAIKLTLRDLNEQERVSIASIYVEKRPKMTTNIIDWFLITNPSYQEEIAMKIIKNEGPICSNIRKLNIKDETLRIKIAKEAIKNGIYMVPDFIDKFNIKNQNELFEIARMSIAGSSSRVAKNISKFKLQDEGDRIKIAREIMNVNGRALAEYIDKFDILNEDVIISFARVLAEKFPESLAENIEKFNISSEEERFDIARKIAIDVNGCLSYFIKGFHLQNEEYRIQLAKIAAHINGKEITPYINNYEIDDAKVVFDILKEIVITDRSCKSLMLNIDKYKVTDIIDLNYVFNIILSHQDSALNMGIKLRRYKGLVKDIISNTYGLSLKNIAKRIRCVRTLRNIRKLTKFYEDRRDEGLDIIEILGENNGEQILSIIDSQKDERLKEQSMEIVQKLLFAMQNSRASKRYKTELTKLIVELITIRNLSLKEQLIPLSVKLINDNNLSRIAQEMQVNNRKKAYPAIFAVVFDRLSLYEKEGFETLSGLRHVLSISNVLKDSKVVQNILITLNLLDETYLSKSQIRNVIKRMIKVPSKIKLEAKYISCITYLNRVDKLENITGEEQDGIRGIFYEIYKEYLKIDDTQFMDKYENFLKKKENMSRKLEECIMEYVARKNTDEKLMNVTRKFLETMSDINEFRKERYDTNKSEHLMAIKQIYKDKLYGLYNKWTYGLDVNAMFENVGKPEELTKGVKKLMDKLNYERYEYLSDNEAVVSDSPVDLFLIGTEVEGSCQSVSYNGDFNSCLMGYVMDGKNKAIVMKNDKGRIIARSIIRLLIDEKTNEVIMVREKIYRGVGVDESNLYKIDERCIDYAKWLGVSLVCEDYENKNVRQRYQGTLLSKGCQVPYEYVDIGKRDFSDEQGYRISNDGLVYLYNVKK